MSYSLKTSLLSFLCCGLLSAASVEHYYKLACDSQGRLGSVQELAEAGQQEKLHALLQKGANPNQIDELGRSPLHLAVLSGHAAAAKVLIEHGADCLAKDAQGRIPTQLAKNAEVKAVCEAGLARRLIEVEACKSIEQGMQSVLAKALSEGLNPNAFAADNTMPLLGIAIRNKKLACVKLLLAAGADPKARLVDSNASILSIAGAVGTAAIVEALLEKGADAMVYNKSRSYPIHEAIWNRNSDVVKVLLPSYAKINFSPDGGRNGLAAEMAISRGTPRILAYFIDAGLDINHPMFKTPLLTLAVQSEKIVHVKMLLEAGAKKNALDEQGKKAADYAHGEIEDLLEN